MTASSNWRSNAFADIRCAITSGCPALRIADMWLRPRTEMLPLNSRWWEYADDTQDCVLATLWGALNLLFLAAAVMGVVRGPRPQYLALMLLFVLLRSAFLGTLENPEPRYTLGVLSGCSVAGGSVDFRLEALATSRIVAARLSTARCCRSAASSQPMPPLPPAYRETR